jgi:hypothetical protein
VASSRSYLQRHGVEPGELPTVGHFDPQYLVLKLALDSNLWTATSEWFWEHEGKPPPLDLSDPYDRMTAQAFIVREHELAHFTTFLTNPFATTIQCYGMMRDLQILMMARILHDAGQSKLRIPLKGWRGSYDLDTATATRMGEAEASLQGYTAISGMLMYGLRGVRLPGSLDSNAPSSAWLPICHHIQNAHVASGGFSLRDLHEGLAVIAETRAMAIFGVPWDQYMKLRGGLYGEYLAVPDAVYRALGGWYEMTAGIALTVAIALPAIAVLLGERDWQRFDATACLTRVLQVVTRLGPSHEYVASATTSTVLNASNTYSALNAYIGSIFEHCYPGFHPADLLRKDNLAKIELAFGVDRLKNIEGISYFLPSLNWLEKTQNDVSAELSWERWFLPIELKTDRWFPCIL